MIKLIYNPNCSKSRAALKYLEDEAIEFQKYDYLKEGINSALIKEILKKTGLPIHELVRPGEKEYKEHFKGQESPTTEEIVSIIEKHPIVLQRPIVLMENEGVIARPVDKLKSIYF